LNTSHTVALYRFTAILGAMIIDLQLSSAHNDWPVIRDAVLEAEAQGYGTTWVLDHFDGSVFTGGDRDVLECCTLLGALAAATTTIGLGSLVANVANRHPAVLAAAMSSTHRISGGRLIIGIGAGAAPDTPWSREHEERGIPLLPELADRHAAVVRQIEVLRCIEPIPIIVGVNSESLARIAGLHADGVNVRLSSPNAARYLAAAREAAGDKRFDCSGWASVHDPASQEKANELGLDRLILSRLERHDSRLERH
jgi:alkanesulfonate monooxygenase SsuD/methylene tetrahydromethanopterin reductase-like flavin-dependent oxidoreductase (luciferase family)